MAELSNSKSVLSNYNKQFFSRVLLAGCEYALFIRCQNRVAKCFNKL